MDILSVFLVVASLFIIMAFGFTSKKLKWVDEKTSKQISLLLVKIGQPCLIISSLVKIEYSPEKLRNGLYVFLIGMGLHTAVALMANLVCRILKKNPDKRKIAEYSMLFSNGGFIGFPVLGAMLGPVGVFYANFYVISFHIFTWTWGMIILGRGRDDIKVTPLNIVLNFGTLPCLIGVLLYLTQCPIPAMLLDAMSSVGAICTPLSVFLCGMLLANRTAKQIFTDPTVLFTCFFKMIVFPLILGLAAKLIGLPDEFVYICVIFPALPTASNAVMFSELYGIESGYAAQTVGISTALCVVTVPFVLWVANSIIAL